MSFFFIRTGAAVVVKVVSYPVRPAVCYFLPSMMAWCGFANTLGVRSVDFWHVLFLLRVSWMSWQMASIVTALEAGGGFCVSVMVE